MPPGLCSLPTSAGGSVVIPQTMSIIPKAIMPATLPAVRKRFLGSLRSDPDGSACPLRSAQLGFASTCLNASPGTYGRVSSADVGLLAREQSCSRIVSWN